MLLHVCSVVSSFLGPHGLSMPEYWSGFPFPPAGDLPDPGIKLRSPVLAGGFFTTEPPAEPWLTMGPSLKDWPGYISKGTLQLAKMTATHLSVGTTPRFKCPLISVSATSSL